MERHQSHDTSEADGVIERIGVLIDKIGTKAKAAEVAGVGRDMIWKYQTGASKPSFQAVSRLAKEAGMSLDWVAFGTESKTSDLEAGEGAKKSFDLELMAECIEATEELLDEMDIRLKAQERAEIMTALYLVFKLQTDSSVRKNIARELMLK